MLVIPNERRENTRESEFKERNYFLRKNEVDLVEI